MRLAALAALTVLAPAAAAQTIVGRSALPSPVLPSAALRPAPGLMAAPLPSFTAPGLHLPRLALPAAPAALSVVPAPVPAAAAPLPVLAVLSDGARTVANAVQAPSAGAAYGLAASLFDGAGRAPAAAAPALPPYLSVGDAADAAWTARVVDAAQGSRTARRVLRRVAALAAGRGRPVPVELGRTRLGGEFDYDTEVLRLSRSHQRADPVDAVPVLVHELLHVLQKERGLPSDAFEMELEAYMHDFRVGLELGLGPATRPWDRQVERRFRGDLGRFLDWLLKEYADNRGLVRMAPEEYARRVEADAAAARRRIARAEAELAERGAALERLRGEGAPAGALSAFAAAELAPRLERARGARVALAWAERDLALLRDPGSLRRYRAYSRRVMALVRRTHAAYARSSRRI